MTGSNKKKWQTAPWTIGQMSETAAQKTKPGPGGPARGKGQKALGSSPRPSSGPEPSGQTGSVFVNPYNFIRLDSGKAAERRAPLEPFDVHARFHDELFTGRLTCRLEVASPLFTPDPEATKPARRDTPKEMSFCRDTGKRPLIPATTLKGMVRSVYEAVTHSCLSQWDDARLSFREARISQNLKPALVENIDTDRNEATLILFDGKAWLPAGYKGGDDFRNTEVFPFEKGLQFAFARIKKVPDIHKGNRTIPVDYRITAKLETSPEPLCSPPLGPDEFVTQVAIKHTGRTISNKHDERVFFFRSSDLAAKGVLPAREPVRISLDAVRDLDFILREKRDRFERKKGDFGATKEMQVRLNRKGAVRIQKNDLVYTLRRNGRVDLALVLVPRLRYGKSPLECAPDEVFHPCRDFKSLCPACRLFGLVSGDQKQGLAGRVLFSAATYAGKETPRFERRTLTFLNSPQPTATNFYLIDRGATNARPIKIIEGGYDSSEAVIRGTKRYWLHADPDNANALAAAHYKIQATEKRRDLCTRVELLLPEDSSGARAAFRFAVDFENLTEDELRHLVWTLELEEGMFHQLGMGKPLGLGVVKIRIERGEESFCMTGEDLRAHYASLTSQPADLRRRVDVDGMVRHVAEQGRGSAAYEDLAVIMRYQPDVAPHLRYVGHEWFKSYKDKQPLRTIAEIKAGKLQTS